MALVAALVPGWLTMGRSATLVSLGWAVVLMAATRWRMHLLIAAWSAHLVALVGYYLAGVVGVLVAPVVAGVFLLGAWDAAGRAAVWAVTRGPILARAAYARAYRAAHRMRRRPGRDDLPIPAFRDGALYVPEQWWTAHTGDGPAAQLAALDHLGRMLPAPERQAFTRAMLDAIATGDRIEVRHQPAAGGRS